MPTSRRKSGTVQSVTWDGTLKLFAAIIKEVGITNFIVLSMTGFLFYYASPEQKLKFIDRWFLLENANHPFCVFIILGLIICIIFCSIIFGRINHLNTRELSRVREENNKLQEALLKRQGITNRKKEKV